MCADPITRKPRLLGNSSLPYNCPDTIFPSVPGPLHPTDPLFYKLGVLKVQDVFKLQVSKFMFNCLQLNILTIFHNWFGD